MYLCNSVQYSLDDDGIETVLLLFFQCLEERSNLLPGNTFWIDNPDDFLAPNISGAVHYVIGKSALLKGLQLGYCARWENGRRFRRNHGQFRLRLNHPLL